jgi:hypothetical protein
MPESSAQTAAAPSVLEACSPGKAAIVATALPDPAQAEPGRKVFDLERCPVGNRPIRDVEVGSVLPAPGEMVYAETLTTEGADGLEIRHRSDGTVVLDHVGADASEEVGSDLTVAATAPSECQDTAYLQFSYRLYATEPWYFQQSSTPSELSVSGAVDGLRQGGVNVQSVRNNCGIGDGVGPGLSYQGNTSRGTGIDAQANCVSSDGVSVVNFGDLPASSGVVRLAHACQWAIIKDSAWDELIESDVKFNKTDASWTNDPLTSSCNNRYGVEPVMTHERGHTFGLNHADPESEHTNLTMSPRINGPCQGSESTLGRGDASGLNAKYP